MVIACFLGDESHTPFLYELPKESLKINSDLYSGFRRVLVPLKFVSCANYQYPDFFGCCVFWHKGYLRSKSYGQNCLEGLRSSFLGNELAVWGLSMMV